MPQHCITQAPAPSRQIKTQAYLRFVVERIADWPSNRIGELLPWAVAGQIKADLAPQRLVA